MDTLSNDAEIAIYYSALLNAIEQAEGELPDDLLEAVNHDLEQGDWIVEEVDGVWQARPAEDAEESEAEDA